MEQDCPEGLLFSYNGYCDFAIKVDCGKRIIPENVNQAPNQIVQQPAIQYPSYPPIQIVDPVPIGELQYLSITYL